jgi:anthranilate phosphoribosyltransferase
MDSEPLPALADLPTPSPQRGHATGNRREERLRRPNPVGAFISQICYEIPRMASHLDFPTVFAELHKGKLSPATTRGTFDAILSGTWSPVQIGGFLAALRMRGEDPETIAAAARSMRENMQRVEHSFAAVLDTCGTGGDGSGTVNLSTGAAIMCAAHGAVVAKHGNRAVSSKSGSADVLAALGIPSDLPAAAAGELLTEVGITFLMAPTFHPAMRFAVPVRKELKVRTIFNCLGPLANPAGATHQVIGAFADELRPVLAQTLLELGTRRAWVVRGEDGMDEVSPYGATRVTELADGRLSERTLTPEDFGLKPSPQGAAQGGDAEANAAIIRSVLSGEQHPARDAFILNAAAALVVWEGLTLRAAADAARAVLDDGRALQTLERWRLAVQGKGSK